MLEQQFFKDELQVKVFDNRTAMGVDAAADVARTMRALLQKKSHINMIFAAAPSQSDFLRALREEKEIDWSRVNVFHMDEYIGISIEQEQSFARFVKTYVADPFEAGAFYPLNGMEKDISSECARYTALLAQYPTDIVCMGIGENGHIAFNDPWVADFADTAAVKPVELDATCRQQQVNDGCFPSLADVPTHAMTLTVPTLVKAPHLFCIVPAPTKANAVRETLCGEIDEHCPASILRTRKGAVLYLDSDSAALL